MKKQLLISSVSAAISLLALQTDAETNQIVPNQPQDNANDQCLFLAPPQYDTNLLVAGHRSHSSHSSHRSGSSGYSYAPSNSTSTYSSPSNSVSSPSTSTTRSSVVKESSTATPSSGTSSIKADSSLISLLQTRLKKLGYPITTIDGSLGLDTQRAIKLFQLEHGLTPDGVPSKSLLDLTQ